MSGKFYEWLGYFFCELCFKWGSFCTWALDPADIGIGALFWPPFGASYRLGCWFYAKGDAR